MNRLVGLGIGANQMRRYGLVALVGVGCGLLLMRPLFINHLSVEQLSSEAKLLGNVSPITSYLPVDISDLVSDTPSTRHFLPPTMLLTF